MELVKMISALQKKIDEDKQKLADAKANKRALETRVTELSDELVRLMGTNTLKEAFTKIYQLTELEKSLETVIQEVLVCYNSGELSKLNELNSKVGEITAKIEEIKNKRVDIPTEKETEEHTQDSVEIKSEKDEDTKEESVKEESVKDESVKEEPKKVMNVPTSVAKKKVVIPDDEDEDLID